MHRRMSSRTWWVFNWRIPTTDGASVPTWIPTPHWDFGRPLSLGRAIVEDLVAERSRRELVSTSSWELAWIPSSSAIPPRARTSASSRSISPRPKRGSANDSLSSATTFPTGCASFPSTSRLARPWRDQLLASDFNGAAPTIVASTGVSMYLTRDAVASTLRQVATLAPGSNIAMSFLLPLESLDVDEEQSARGAARGAQAEGTPWMSFFTPEQMLEMADVAAWSTLDTSPVPCWPNAISRIARMTSGRPGARTFSWPQPPERTPSGERRRVH